MSKTPMTRKQKELAVLGAVLALGGIALLYMFMWTPWMEGRARRFKNHNELISKIQKARRLQSQVPQMIQKSGELRSVMSRRIDQMVAPSDNAFLWANGVLDTVVRSAGLTLESVSEVAMTRPLWVRPPESKAAADARKAAPDASSGKNAPPLQPKRFGPYRISCSIIGDFRDIVELVRSLQQENPYLSIIRLDVVSIGVSGDNQRAQLIIEWPRHSGELDKDLAGFLLANEEMEDSSRP